jgi:diadenosine tetraphosphate (Ap4A) HIT family hydrolase
LSASAADDRPPLPKPVGTPWEARLAPADAPLPDNKFLKILEGKAPAEVVDSDGDLFTFRDIRPASRLHFLVVPNQKYKFVRDASQLVGPADADLVRRMEVKAKALVAAEVGADAFDPDELALGFHGPPWYSVPWLHLHAIYPKSEMKRRYKYTPFSFYSPERVIEGLEKGEKASASAPKWWNDLF